MTFLGKQIFTVQPMPQGYHPEEVEMVTDEKALAMLFPPMCPDCDGHGCKRGYPEGSCTTCDGSGIPKSGTNE